MCAFERSEKGMEFIMKFMKGIMIGGLITTGIVMMYSEGMMNKKVMMKKGKKMAKKMGIM